MGHFSSAMPTYSICISKLSKDIHLRHITSNHNPPIHIIMDAIIAFYCSPNISQTPITPIQISSHHVQFPFYFIFILSIHCSKVIVGSHSKRNFAALIWACVRFGSILGGNLTRGCCLSIKSAI